MSLTIRRKKIFIRRQLFFDWQSEAKEKPVRDRQTKQEERFYDKKNAPKYTIQT